jgi:hypothetical protein
MRRLAVAVAFVLGGCTAVYDTAKLGPGSSASDGGGDAQIDSGEAGERFCNVAMPRPTFCADFEGDLRDGWENAHAVPDPLVAGGGVLEVDSAPSADGTRAAAMSIPAASAGAHAGNAYLLKTFDPAAPVIEFEFDVNLETAPSAGSNSTVFAEVDFGLSGAAGGAYLFRNGTGDWLTVIEGSAIYGAKVKMGPLPSSQWLHMRIRTENQGVDGGTGTVKVFLDTANRIAEAPLPVSFQGERVTNIAVGATASAGPLAAFRVAFDNVRVELVR